MTQPELVTLFEREVASGDGEILGFSALASSVVKECNEYIRGAGYESVSETILPQVMILGVVRKGLFQRPYPIPSMIKTARDPQRGWNHEDAFRALCDQHAVRPFRPRNYSYWLGFVLREDAAADTYHLVLNTYGDLDGMNTARRADIASNLVGVLQNVKACAVIESTDSVFDARTGNALTAHERGIDFSVPW